MDKVVKVELVDWELKGEEKDLNRRVFLVLVRDLFCSIVLVVVFSFRMVEFGDKL